MPRSKTPNVPLTDFKLKELEIKEKSRWVHDQRGLYVHVKSNGSKLFVYKFNLNGAVQQVSLGSYHEVSLAAARRAHDVARVKVQQGQHPHAETKTPAEELLKYNFERIALQWHAVASRKLDKKYSGVILRFLQREIFTALGAADIREIKRTTVQSLLIDIKDRGAAHLREKKMRWETQKKARQRISAIYRYAANVLEMPVIDPIPAILPYLEEAPEPEHLPAITNLDGIRQILKETASGRMYATTKLAIYFTALTCVRSSEVRGATWDEFDLNAEAPVWHIPALRMKAGRPHVVHITPQLLAVIEALRAENGNCQYVFEGRDVKNRKTNKPISENTVNKALHKMGYKGEHVGHGFRSAFSTIMNEIHPELETVINSMLAHKVGTSVSRAYNRGHYAGPARKLAEEYAAMLMDGMPNPSDLLGGPAH